MQHYALPACGMPAINATSALNLLRRAVLLSVVACRSDGSYSGNPGSGGGNGPPGADMDISAAELVNRLSFHVSNAPRCAACTCCLLLFLWCFCMCPSSCIV
jgi:hypothetical protein